METLGPFKEVVGVGVKPPALWDPLDYYRD